jgi:hypothetical protein
LKELVGALGHSATGATRESIVKSGNNCRLKEKGAIMNQKFERIARHLYQRSTAPPREIGPRSTMRGSFAGSKGESRVIPLGSDESLAKDKLKKIEAHDVDLHDFDLDRERLQEPEKEPDGKSAPFNFAEWSEKYPTFDDVKRKRSLPTNLLQSKPIESSKVRNVQGLVFTNPDGSPITKGQIEYQTEKAVKNAEIRKFVFHNYRNTALTCWAARASTSTWR